jgi:hypothetical protein
MLGQILVVIIPPVDELGFWICKLMHPMADVAERSSGRGLVYNANARVIDMQRYRMLVVDKQCRLGQCGLLQEASRASLAIARRP